MVNKVKDETGWNKIDYLELHGNYSSGRTCTAKSGNEEFKYYYRTYGDGRVMEYKKL